MAANIQAHFYLQLISRGDACYQRCVCAHISGFSLATNTRVLSIIDSYYSGHIQQTLRLHKTDILSLDVTQRLHDFSF